MIGADASALGKQLSALAEVYDKRPLTPAAVQVWMDTLREFHVDQVMRVLEQWARAHSKFPAPAEVWRECSNIVEAKATQQRLADNDVRGLMRTISRQEGKTQYAAECAGIARRFFSGFGKARPRKAWAARVLKAQSSGGYMTYVHPATGETMRAMSPIADIAVQFAREALGEVRVREREPGEDDE